MTQHKYQMSQTYYHTPKHDLGVSGINVDYIEVITPIKVREHGQLRQLLGNLFDVFSNKESIKYDSPCEEDTIIKQTSDNNEVENTAMLDLENCANVAREIGACGQNKLKNKSDET